VQTNEEDQKQERIEGRGVQESSSVIGLIPLGGALGALVLFAFALHSAGHSVAAVAILVVGALVLLAVYFGLLRRRT
jgi:nitrate/nitrite transporter NarK